jgi:hypothetical protein
MCGGKNEKTHSKIVNKVTLGFESLLAKKKRRNRKQNLN